MARAKKKEDWFTCPVCGDTVRMGALACPGCGADDRTGWSAKTEYDGLDLPEDDAGDASGNAAGRRPARGAWIVVTAAILLALFFLFEILRG